MMRNRTFRRLVLATTLFMGLFTQFQTVFACEFKDGKLQITCCCETSGDMSQGCDMGGGCDLPAGLVNSDGNCCETSYQAVPGVTAITPQLHVQQVLLLDAPQPPPVLVSSLSHPVPVITHSYTLPHQGTSSPLGTLTYLRTQRLRI